MAKIPKRINDNTTIVGAVTLRNILPEIDQWMQEGKQIALATVVEVYGSAPRPVGSKMAVSSNGDMVGSVSGGCIEGAILEKALEVINTGEPALSGFGITDELATSVGLACGGTIKVFIEPINW